MKVAAIIEYTTDSEKIARVRPAHRAYLMGLKDQGNVVIAGPFLDDSGGILVYEGESQEQVEGFIREDPFAKEGVFVSWVLRPWKVVTLNPALLTP